ncbi:hypothetical protein DY052_05970 [Apilactobacillus timberlakei]|uniref:hypothetical protein n=1 Tax=Apilactobacillus timberlakei TaxID=2008380 RepID=UPI00112EF166|nr:hypothetical protein [Apilactobacillus timberlakei]TPR14970.1 hypothetical protein DY052_05970 [Apilactobacillus timberlakei]
MPSRQNVEEQKPKDNLENSNERFIDNNVLKFMKKYNTFNNSKQKYISSIVNVAEKDPQAFIDGNMTFNGFKKNKKKEWYLPQPKKEYKKTEKEPKDERNNDKKELNYLDDDTPTYNSNPGMDYGFIGNMMYKASYSLTYHGIQTGFALYDGVKQGNKYFQSKRNYNNIPDDLEEKNTSQNNENEDLKTNLEKYIDDLSKENTPEQEIAKNEHEIGDLVSNSLGFERVRNVLDKDKLDLKDDKSILENINVSRNPDIPKVDDITLKAKSLTKELKEYNKDPEKYMDFVQRQENKMQEEIKKDDMKMDENKINLAIVQGTPNSYNKALTLNEFKQIDPKGQDSKQPYTLVFSDGLAKEYKDMDGLQRELLKNEPKQIHDEVKKDYQNKFSSDPNIKLKDDEDVVHETPEDKPNGELINEKELLSSLDIDYDENIEMKNNERRERLRNQRNKEKFNKNIKQNETPEMRM